MTVQFNVDAAISKLGELTATHGPQAVETASAVVQINAVNTLAGVPGWGILAAACFFGVRYVLAHPKKTYHNGDNSHSDGQCVLLGFLIVFGGGFFVGAVVCLFNVWAWVALFNPKLALAHEIMEKLL